MNLLEPTEDVADKLIKMNVIYLTKRSHFWKEKLPKLCGTNIYQLLRFPLQFSSLFRILPTGGRPKCSQELFWISQIDLITFQNSADNKQLKATMYYVTGHHWTSDNQRSDRKRCSWAGNFCSSYAISLLHGGPVSVLSLSLISCKIFYYPALSYRRCWMFSFKH